MSDGIVGLLLLTWAVCSPVVMYGVWRHAQERQRVYVRELQGQLIVERKLHEGDHELIDAMTGIKGSYMWRPAMLRAYGMDRRKAKLDTAPPSP